MTPRPYRDSADWEAMCQILREGRAADNGTYYVHTGDVSWWLYYPDQSAEFARRIHLWEENGAVVGWCLLTPDERALDVFVHPRLRGTPQAEAIFVWAEAELTARLRAAGEKSLEVFWVFETDEWRVPFLEGRGYVLKGSDPHFTRALNEPIPEPALPEGFCLRPSVGEVEAVSRAQASYAAFQSDREWGSYLQRRLTFMRSPVYADERDLVAVAPDGRIAAFCIIWFDMANKVGLFEPVGTHPEFQRRGLGRALLYFALRRMQAAGMETATVGTSEGNDAAIGLYQSVGFQRANRLRLYSKAI
jgi:ribosomal protein S18 acetylase RimI-like enzyme